MKSKPEAQVGIERMNAQGKEKQCPSRDGVGPSPRVIRGHQQHQQTTQTQLSSSHSRRSKARSQLGAGNAACSGRRPS